jgi:hypothetical protein
MASSSSYASLKAYYAIATASPKAASRAGSKYGYASIYEVPYSTYWA